MLARGLDHLVVGVHDLDAAGAFYEKLGFTVGARNRHPWGTHNRIVQFPGAFLEIITVAEPALIPGHSPGRFSFGAFVRDALARGEGLSMLVLESADAAADNAAFHASGIGAFEPFFFERQAMRPDGSARRVAFTLAFASNPDAPGQGFFVCQHHEPQNFWSPEFQRHANGALGVTCVTFVADAPADHGDFFAAFTGASEPTVSGHGIRFSTPRGVIDVVTPGQAARSSGFGGAAPAFAGFAVAVSSLSELAKRLDGQGVAHAQYGTRLNVQAYGLSISFEQA